MTNIRIRNNNVDSNGSHLSLNLGDDMTTSQRAFLSTVQAEELRAKCSDFGDEYYARYFELRDAVRDHDEAMNALTEDISATDCQRLTRAGGSTQEIADLMQTFFNADHSNEEPIDEYIILRCQRGISADEAFSQICRKYDVDEVKYSEDKLRSEGAEGLLVN